MEITEAIEFLATNHRAVLGNYKPNGEMQLSPIMLAPHADGTVEISSRETAYKVKNLRRDPRATVCVMNDAFFGKWILVEGRAEIVALPEAMEGLVDLYRRMAGEHPDWDDYRAAMEREQRVLIRITIERAGPDKAG
ncbi:MAG: putative F420-dependent enzyme [Acidimicrobiia bacterium]|nr:putative F420-dependent enzyme [Acidimicrobiia bacterium]